MDKRVMVVADDRMPFGCDFMLATLGGDAYAVLLRASAVQREETLRAAWAAYDAAFLVAQN